MDELNEFVEHGLRKYALSEGVDDSSSKSTRDWWDELPGKRRKKVVLTLGLKRGKDKVVFDKMDGGEQSEIEAYFVKHKGRVEGFEDDGDVLVEGKALTSSQKSELEKELVKNGTPVRFLRGGKAVNILTGDEAPKGSNVMYHPVYWNFTRETAKKVAAWLGAKAVFSK